MSPDVNGGWLPLPFATPPRFLVDRNVVILLKKLRLGQATANGPALDWWTKLFKQGSALFNPYLYAFEAGFQRKPTLSEFIAAFDEGVDELRAALPNCEIIEYTPADYRAAYSQLEAFDERSKSESEFLIHTCALVAQRVSREDEQLVLEAILAAADQLKIPRAAFVVLAALSCLYEDIRGEVRSIGRDLIKPRTPYTEANAFNALSDLRHIELAAAGQAHFKNNAFALCTCDRGVAAFWSALAPRGVANDADVIELTFDLTAELFPRLSEEEIISLRDLLAA